MRRVFVVLLLLVAIVAGVGFYLDWFRVSTGGTGDAGKINVDLTIDKDKIKADAEGAKEKVQGLGSKSKGVVTPNSPNDSSPPPESPKR